MNIDDYIASLEEVSNFIKNELPEIAARTVAMDLVGNIESRVINDGENAYGSQFSPYSTNKVPASLYDGKSRPDRKSAQTEIEKLIDERGFISYAEFRELNGLYSDKKNFNFTGDMWKRFGITGFKKNEKGFEITLGGKTTDSQHKIDENSRMEGYSIIEESDKEETFFNEDLQDIVNQKMQILSR